MATVEESVTSHLKAHAGLSALVSTRVYPLRLPQNATYPAVTYFVVDNEHLYRHGGAGGFAEPRFQIDAWASTFLSARAVSEQVRLAMNAFTGTVAGVAISYADALGEQHLSEPEIGVYHIAQDFRVTHVEAVA